MISNDQAIGILQDIIHIKSTTRDELGIARYIENLLEKYLINSRTIQHRDGCVYLIAETLGGAPGKILGLHGTMSVEPDWDAMSSEIEELQILDGEMHGRGVSGMNSGLVALLIAFINMSKTKHFNGILRLILVIGEEVEPFEASPFSIERYGNDLNALLVAEPSDNTIVHMHNGTLKYLIVYHGQHMNLLEFEPEQTVIEFLLDFITFFRGKIESALDISNEILGKPTNSIIYIQGGNEWNSELEYAEFMGEAQTIPEFNNNDLINLISDAIDEFNSDDGGHEIDCWIENNTPVAIANPDSKLIQVIQQVSHRDNLQVGANSYPTEAGKFLSVNKDLDVAIYGPGDTNPSELMDSYISIEGYLEFISNYNKIIEGYTKIPD